MPRLKKSFVKNASGEYNKKMYEIYNKLQEESTSRF